MTCCPRYVLLPTILTVVQTKHVQKHILVSVMNQIYKNYTTENVEADMLMQIL